MLKLEFNEDELGSVKCTFTVIEMTDPEVPVLLTECDLVHSAKLI